METIVLYPSPGMGHLISMVELGKLILRHRPSASITILTVPPSFNTGSTAAYIRQVSAAFPSIAFHHLPPVPLDLHAFPSMESLIFETLRRCNPAVRAALEAVSAASAFIIDFFCTSSLPIAAELGIPSYYFVTSGAAVLAFFLHFPMIHNTTSESFKDMDKDKLIEVPGLPLFPVSDMILPLLDRESSDYKDFLEFSLYIPKTSGIIVNTFEKLETRSLRTIREGKCNPNGRTPPVFTIGPLLATGGGATAVSHDCLKWLDEQPSKSVIYLSFGSLGLFSAAQLREIAVGLENSGHRFLWVVRSPPSEDERERFLPPSDPDLDALLPTGFLDRTAGRGYVVKSWAPQVAVLGHGSVGGFVTHCGWNSVLEAVCAAVPMVAWPLYAEQKMNRALLVEEMNVALRMATTEDGFVAAEEVERRVKEMMETERGEAIRRVVEEMSSEAKAAMAEGGSSIAALGELVESWKKC